MLNKLKPKSEFSRNVLTLMTGSTIAQTIPIAISPILTRIYTPSDFGIFALYMSIASILSILATGRYELAIMLPKKDSDAINIVVLSIVIACVISFISFIVVLIFNNQIANLLKKPEISNWLYFIPITILFTGLYQSFNYWSNRKKQYKRLAGSRVIQTSTTSINNLAMGFNGFGVFGLIFGNVLGRGLSTAILGKMILNEDIAKLKYVKKFKILILMKKYIDFPKINLPHSFLNVMSSNIPVLIIGIYFNSMMLGFFSLANRVLLAPMSIITGSYGQVFMQKLVHHKNIKMNEVEFFKTNVLKILTYSFIPFLLLFVFAPNLFTIIFGETWKSSGVYAQILIPMLFFRFTGSIVSSVTMIYNQQKKALIIESINSFLRLISLLIGGISQNIILGLILFSLFSSIVTIYRLFWYVNIIKKDKE